MLATIGLGGVTAASLGLGVGWALARPRPLRWTGIGGRVDGLVNALAGWLRRHLQPAVLTQADVLQIASRELLGIGLGAAVGVGLGVAVLFPVRWLGLFAAAAAFTLAPTVTVRRRFRAYQSAMQMAFEPQVLLLRIYFDLGMSLPMALRTLRDALHGAAQRELDRVLSDWAEGRRDAAFHAWAARTQLMEYRLLADTIVQQRGRALRGSALDPLDTLLVATRQQSMKTLTDQVLANAGVVPIVAAMALTLLYLYALVANVQGLQALHFHW